MRGILQWLQRPSPPASVHCLFVCLCSSTHYVRTGRPRSLPSIPRLSQRCHLPAARPTGPLASRLPLTAASPPLVSMPLSPHVPLTAYAIRVVGRRASSRTALQALPCERALLALHAAAHSTPAGRRQLPREAASQQQWGAPLRTRRRAAASQVMCGALAGLCALAASVPIRRATFSCAAHPVCVALLLTTPAQLHQQANLTLSQTQLRVKAAALLSPYCACM
jgi:hypothetical protein